MGIDASDGAERATPPSNAGELTLRAGEVLMREGEVGDTAYEVVAGALEILRGPTSDRVDLVGPGGTLGEIAMLAGVPRMATVRAVEPSVVRAIDHADYERWVGEDDRRATALADVARSRIDRHRLVTLIADLLGVAPGIASDVAAASEWTYVAAGESLFNEGDRSDAAYLVVSGRLAALREGRRIGEVARGEIVGEVGLIERTARSASVVALRDSTLARFDVDAFRTLTAAHPALMLQVSRTILARIARPNTSTDRARSIAVAVVAPLDTRLTVTRLASELSRHGTTHHLWAAGIESALGRPGMVESGSSLTMPALSEYLQEAETLHDYLILETDQGDSRWTRLALGLADRIVVIMSANPDESELRRAEMILAAAPTATRVERWLAVLHPRDTERPSGSALLADRFGFDRVAHLREGAAGDFSRLARLVSGNGTGLVLGGGGARGFAHLGVWRAMREVGIEVDAIGGASIGAPLGVMMALQFDPDELEVRTARLFRGLLDYTVPVVSLLKGERIARNITETLAGIDLRDTWHPFFCVSTNLTRSRVEVHDRLDAATAIRASVAIPGVLPPVPFDEDLLVDGGVLNNLPCDVMNATGTVSRVIAVDLSPPVGPRASDDYGLSVSGWKALRAQIGSERSRFPGIVAIIMRAMVAGSARDRDQMLADGTVDCYLDLELPGVRLLDFERVGEIAARGYEAALPRLEAWRRDDQGLDRLAADDV